MVILGKTSGPKIIYGERRVEGGKGNGRPFSYY